MCAHYTVFTEEEIIEMRAIIEEVSRKLGQNTLKTGHIGPTDTAPVLTLENHRLTPIPAQFGFSKWDGKGVIFNARSDTALEKKMFAKSLLTSRCVIPSTGFYEWSHEGGKTTKEKYLLRRAGDQMLYMAGMMGRFMGKDGVMRDCFVILTTDANASISTIHNRMPVILSTEERANWLSDDHFMRLVLARKGPELVLEKAC